MGGQIRVGIVGAGFAGLRCADVLLQHGFEVSIFEARNRIGGRVAQSDHLGHLVDLGPNWIHGTKGNTISEIAKQVGTHLHAWEEEQIIVGTEGTRLDDDEVEEHVRLLWDDGLIAEAFRYSEVNSESIDPARSLYDYFVDKAESLFLSDAVDIAAKKRETFVNIASEWGAYIGTPIQKQSLRFFWLEQCIEGENPFMAETYRSILEDVARNAVSSADIYLNHKVLMVKSSAGSEQQPVMETEKFNASFDAIVVTTPLGWLKHNQHAFEPALPLKLSQAIENVGYGTLDKVYITFPSAFWNMSVPPKQPCANGIDPGTKTPNVTTTTTPLHQPPSHGTENQYPAFFQWLSPSYAQDTNPERWAQQAVSLAALPSKFAHPTLLFYIYGDCSKHVADIVGSAASHEERDQRLIEFSEPYYARLSNYDKTNPDCKPKAVLATAWANDEFAGFGSYSNFQIGIENGDRDIETMRYGMPERRVLFAGEHTAPFLSYGTTTGAYISGEKVAERIVEAVGLR